MNVRNNVVTNASMNWKYNKKSVEKQLHIVCTCILS